MTSSVAPAPPCSAWRLVLIFMALVYRLPGVLADVALVIYVLAMLALLAVSHAVAHAARHRRLRALDRHGGRRERADLRAHQRRAVERQVAARRGRTGFTRAFSAVFDSHFTTIVGAGVLFMLGTGTVQGFAFTLFWGTVFSLFTAVFVTRFFIDLFVDNNLLTDQQGVRRASASLSVRLNWNIVGWFRTVSTISYAIIALGVAAMIYHGLRAAGYPRCVSGSRSPAAPTSACSSSSRVDRDKIANALHRSA